MTAGGDGDPADGGNEDRTGSERDDTADDGREDDRFPDDPERAALVRDIADEVRGDSSQSEQLAAILYRVSDLYDPDEDTTPEEIHRNVKTILQIKERGTLER